MITHGSLFSGIGGFDLASHKNGFKNEFHCEIDEFGRGILNHYWPKSISYADIKSTDFTIHAGRITVLSGGFPCQPFSKAGNKSGKEHDSWLWHEMFRAATEIKPPFIVGENVVNIEKLGLEEMLTDLEGEGYEVWTFEIPAISVGASHQRARIWIVAYNDAFRLQGGKQGGVQEIPRWEENISLQIEELFRTQGGQEWIYQPRICGVIDGVPSRMDQERNKALGNAIVPIIASIIFSAIDDFLCCT